MNTEERITDNIPEITEEILPENISESEDVEEIYESNESAPAEDISSLSSEEEPKKENIAPVKKLLILYILEVLRNYSDKDHKLTHSQITSLIKKDYDVDCGKKAIIRNVQALIDHGFKIGTYEENGEGYYIDEIKFSPEDAFMLWEGLMSSKYISKDEITALTGKLARYCGAEYRFGSSFYGGVVSRYAYPETFVHYNIMILLTEMAGGKKVKFVYNEYDKEKTFTPVGPKLSVSPYAVVNIDNEYYLAAKEDGEKKGSMSCYKVSLISEIETTSSIAEDIRNVPGYSGGFDVNVFANEFISPFRGETLTCHLNVLTENIRDVIDYFGESFRIVDEEGEYMLLEIVTNEERMYNWAIQNAHISELKEPQILRYKIKDYFDVNSWKYR